jgi:hypothetical protein
VLPSVQQPKFFLDRSLGRIALPSRLRAAGWDLVTLAEHYGRPADEQIADVQWIQDAATHGWPILMKDKRIRYRRAEIDAVVRHRAQCFVITRHSQRGRRTRIGSPPGRRGHPMSLKINTPCRWRSTTRRSPLPFAWTTCAVSRAGPGS